MADTDVNAITGGASRFVPANPLDTLQKWANYNNSLVQQASGVAGIANTQQSTTNMQQDNEKTAQGMAQNNQDYMARQIVGLLAKPGDISDDDVSKLVNQSADLHAVSDNSRQVMLDSMPKNTDSNGRRQWLGTLLASRMTPAEQAQHLTANVAATDTGDGTQYSRVPGSMNGAPNQGVTPIGSVAGGRMNDRDKTDLVTVTQADGSQGVFFRGQFVGRIPTGGAGTGGTGTGTSALDGPIPRQPGDDAPVQPNPLLPVVPKGNGLPAPIVSVPAQQGQQQADDQKLYQGILGNVAQSKQNIDDLSEAYNLYKGLSGGKGLQFFNENRSRFVALGSVMNMDMGNIASEDARRAMADKLLQRAINNAPGAMRSDAATDAQAHGSPTTSGMSRDAGLYAIRQNIGLQRQQLSSALDFQAKHPGTNGVGFTAANGAYLMNTNRDGFSADHMSQQEFQDRVKALGGIKTARGKEFVRSVQGMQNDWKRGVGESLDADPASIIPSGGQ